MGQASTAQSLIAVFVGGVVGTALRLGVDQIVSSASFPWATVTVNLAGAGALGLLVGAAHRRSGLWAALVGPGLLGSFTTFSALIADLDGLASDRPTTAVAYSLMTLIGGLLLAGIGLRWGRR